MAVDLLAKRDIPETILPSTPSTTTAVTCGVSGAWSGWVQVVASAGLDFILCGMYTMELMQIAAGGGTVAAVYSVQVGTGAAAAEVPIAEGAGCLLGAPAATGTASLVTGRTIFFEPTLIPTGTRIAVRATNSTAIGIGLGLALFGYDASVFPLPVAQAMHYQRERLYKGLVGPTMPSLILPSGALTAVTSGAAANGYGSWVQFVASATRPMLVTGLIGIDVLSGIKAHAEIGIGAALSEITMARVALPGKTLIPGPIGDCYLPRPLFVKTGERVAVRLAASSASQAVDIALRGYEVL